MPSFGWQELFILLVFAILILAPIFVVARGSKRRTGRISTGWVIAALIFGWFAVIAWQFVGRRS